jgi:hypothetical protein
LKNAPIVVFDANGDEEMILQILDLCEELGVDGEKESYKLSKLESMVRTYFNVQISESGRPENSPKNQVYFTE